MMKTYAVNLVVDTKTTDIYDKVALNKFPIIVQCKTESELKDILSNDDTFEFVKQLIKSKRVYESAMFVADYLGWSAVRCDKDGKMRSIEEIHEDVYKLAKKNFTQK